MAIDSLVNSIATYHRRPIITHVYTGPFAIIYACWYIYWSMVLGVDDFWELGCLITAAIVLFQVG